jgi:hypothetical protein
LGHAKLEHYVVRQQDVGRVCHDCIPLFVFLLSRIAGEDDWALFIGITKLQELLRFPKLAICQGVHGIDHDRLNTSAASVPKNVINYRNDVGETFARTCSGCENVVSPGPGALDRNCLVLVQTKGLATPFFFSGAKYSRILWVKHTRRNEIAYCACVLEGRIQLNQRIRPKKTLIQIRGLETTNTLIPYSHETADV